LIDLRAVGCGVLIAEWDAGNERSFDKLRMTGVRGRDDGE
jgi:hypothetical protein